MAHASTRARRGVRERRVKIHVLCAGREFFHSGGASDGYKVGFAPGCLLHSVAKALRNVSGVRVFERSREDVGCRSDNTGSLLYLGGLRAAIVWRRSPLLTSPGASGKESYAT